MQPNRLPRINTANVVNAIAIGAITVGQLARLFGVAEHDRRLLKVIDGLKDAHRVAVSLGDLHTLSLTEGPR